MTPSADVAVVGLGATGSAAAHQLSRRGKSVLGFDRFEPPHTLGSTHGESRIIREAYFENPLYVPIVQRSYDCWRGLEKDYGETVLELTGALLLGPEDGALVAGTRLSADRHGLDYDMLTPAQIRKRYPVFHCDDKTVGVWEPNSGILFPERCVEAHLRLAGDAGAELHYNEPVTDWQPEAGGVRIVTKDGTYHALAMVLAPGAWMGSLIADLHLPLSVERQVLYWFQPAGNRERFELGELPVYAWEFAEQKLFYGTPNLGGGAKIALHHQGVVTDADSIERGVAPQELEGMKVLIARYIPDLGGPLVRAEVCMYTNTPDEHFLIDFHPDCEQVLIVSACSGHGFKFSAVLGEIVANLMIEGRTQFDLSPFRIERLLGDTA